MDWTTEFPETEGLYWFYGYRYGKVSCGRECEPELVLVKCSAIANGFVYIADGHFMYKREVECPHFQKVDVPELPKL